MYKYIKRWTKTDNSKFIPILGEMNSITPYLVLYYSFPPKWRNKWDGLEMNEGKMEEIMENESGLEMLLTTE